MTADTTEFKQVRYTDGSYSRTIEEQPRLTDGKPLDDRAVLSNPQGAKPPAIAGSHGLTILAYKYPEDEHTTATPNSRRLQKGHKPEQVKIIRGIDKAQKPRRKPENARQAEAKRDA